MDREAPGPGELPRVVAAVDGSPGSVAALEWAAAEAKLRQCQLDIVHVWTRAYVYGPLGGFSYPVGPDDFEEEGKETLRRMVEVARAATEGTVRIRTLLMDGSPAPRILEAAEGADLLVVGSRGHGGFTELLVGSVSQQLVHHAPCPVVVVHQPDDR